MRTLTPRQRQIVELLCDDKCRKEIGAALGIAYKTVDYHMRGIRNVLGVKTDFGVIKWWLSQRRYCCPECS